MRFQVAIAAASVILSSFTAPVAGRVGRAVDHRLVSRVDDVVSNKTLAEDATLFNATEFNSTYTNSTGVEGQDLEDTECEEDDEEPFAPSGIVSGSASATSAISPSASAISDNEDEGQDEGEDCEEEEDDSPNQATPSTGDDGDEEDCGDEEGDAVAPSSRGSLPSAVASNKVYAAGANTSVQPVAQPTLAPAASGSPPAGPASVTDNGGCAGVSVARGAS